MKHLTWRLLALAAAASCTSSPRADDVRPAFAELHPQSISVDMSLESGVPHEARAIVRGFVEESLTKRGYAVEPVSDATLYVVVETWRRELQPFNGSSGTRVSIAGTLRDDSSTTLLWSSHATVADSNEDEDADTDVLGSVVDYAISEAVEFATRDLEAAAEDAVHDLLASLPRRTPGAK